MITLLHPLLASALALGTGGAPKDWLTTSGNAGCDGTDVDFSDARHGFASCAFSAAMTTADGGLTWSVFDTGLQQSLVFAHDTGAGELYAARLGFYRSGDGGATWSELGGLSDGGSGSVFDVYFGPGGARVAIQGGQLLASDDGGANWRVTYPGAFGVYFDELHFPSVAVGYASGGDTTEQGSIGSVARTDDGGASWSLLDFPFGEITAADFFDASSGIVATQGGAFYSTIDGGASWQAAGAVPDAAILLDLAHRDARHWYGVSIQGCLYETRDAGLAWQTGYCDPDGRALSALSADGSAVVAVGSSGLALFENRVLRDGFD